MSESTDGPRAKGRSYRLGGEKRQDLRLRVKSGEMSTEGRKSLGPGGRRFASWAGRCCRWHSQLGAGTAPSLSCPRQGPGLGIRGTMIVPEARLPFVGCGERQRALQSFSLGESREKGPGAGCARMEGMGKGYSSGRPHLLGDRQ